MSEDDSLREGAHSHYEGGLPILPGPDDKAKAEEQAREADERSYKTRQLTLDQRMVFFTGALFCCTVITLIIALLQAYIGNKNAEAAKFSAQIARETLAEMQHGGGAQDTHSLAQQAATQAAETATLAKDTHTLAIAAGRQAEASRVIATNAQLQTAETTTLAIAAKKQAMASEETAEAAQRTAETFKQTLYVSERAYISIQNIEVDGTQHVVELPFVNTGHMPSGKVEVINHFAIYATPERSTRAQLNGAAERHWEHIDFPSIPSGSSYRLSVHIPTLDMEKLKDGRQHIVIALTMSYTDGFPDSPAQKYEYCVQTFAFPESKPIFFEPCDPRSMLSLLERYDSYPKNEDQK